METKDVILELRTKKELSQDELAEKVYVTRQAVSRCQSVHLFEAAIDLLSYATLLKAQGKDYKAENLLSLSGVYQPKKESKDSKIPIALSVFLEKNPLIKTIHLHLDNDKTGRLCANTLKELLRNKYEVFDEPPKKGKDYNDYLCIQLGIYKSKERSYER